MGSFNPLLT